MTDTASATQALDTQLGQRFISIQELPEEQKAVLKATVAKGTTDTELAYFLNVAFSQELDPFRKEVWCIKRAKKKKTGDYWDYKRLPDGSIDYTDADLVIMTGRDGFLKMAKRDPTFDRIQSAEVREGDHFVMDPISGAIEHRFGTRRGQILGAYAVITRKDGVKIAKYVTWAEYFDDRSDIWKDNGSAMIVKCCESVLAKQFANVTGIVAEETMRKDGTVIDSSPTAQAQQSSLKDDLIRQIEACTTPEEFTKLRDTIAGTVGKLFGDEKDAVYAAAKRKRAELDALQVSPVELNVQEGKVTVPAGALKEGDTIEAGLSSVKSPQDDPEMPQGDFMGWLEGLAAQETPEGLKDLSEAFSAKPSSPAQKAEFDARLVLCSQEVQPKKQAKKK